MSRSLLDLEADEIEKLVIAGGEKPFRARQVWQWLHARRVHDISLMRNLPAGLRTRLAREYSARVLEPLEHLTGSDGLTEKWLWRAPGAAVIADAANSGATGLVEAVLIREQRRKRRTACVSCMVGCPLGCRFCATGKAGFERDLSRGEILEQVYNIDRHERAAHGKGLTNVVFMGMGEPLLNYREVVAAIRVLLHPRSLGLSGRRVTISTIGIPAAIDRLAGEKINPRLAVSLHAPEQGLREELLPATHRWPLSELLPALSGFATGASRTLTIEYCLIDGINSAPAQARDLARLLAPLPCKVNLIPLNPVAGFPGRPPPRRAVRAFAQALSHARLPVTVRTEKGQDIQAACGQLRAHCVDGDGDGDH